MPSTTICVVDDDPSVRRAVSRLLESFSLKVETFSSAEEFLDAPQTKRFSCLILDIYMDGMSGLDLYDRLTAAGDPAPPIIFVTAHDDPKTRERIGRSGAIAYIRKPFESASLVAAVGLAVGRDLEPPPA
jgi:FixJ family two-component response regulator